jgi:hypothetical protein
MPNPPSLKLLRINIEYPMFNDEVNYAGSREEEFKI